MKYIFIGPSGAGKGTFIKEIIELIPRAISCTTRAPREREIDGKDFYFLKNTEETKKEMLKSVAYDDKHRGVCYFTKEEEFKKHKNCLCEMSEKGVKDLRKYFGKENVKVIYIYANPDQCYERILNRNGREYADMRMYHNHKENSFDNHRIADYVIINNNENDYKKNVELLKYIIKSTMD